MAKTTIDLVQALEVLRKEFSTARADTHTDVSEDHYLLVFMNKKMDIIGQVVLGNGSVEESLVFQVLELRRWREGLMRWFTWLGIPLLLMLITALLAGLWLLLTHQAQFIAHPVSTGELWKSVIATRSTGG